MLKLSNCLLPLPPSLLRSVIRCATYVQDMTTSAPNVVRSTALTAFRRNTKERYSQLPFSPSFHLLSSF